MLDRSVVNQLRRIAEEVHLRPEDEANLSLDNNGQPFIDFSERGGPFAGARTAELIGFYLGQLAAKEQVVKTIFGALILCSIDFAVDRLSLTREIRLLADGFLQAHAADWDATLIENNPSNSAWDFIQASDSPEKAARALLSKRLGLRFPAVCWSLANADPLRVVDLLQVIEQPGLTVAEQEGLYQLVVSSADLFGPTTPDATIRAVETFLAGPIVNESSSARASLILARPPIADPTLSDFGDHYTCYNPRAVISRELGLRWPALHWVRANRSPERLEELLRSYLENLDRLRPVAWFDWLGQLVLESLSAFTTDQQLDEQTSLLVLRFVQEQRGEQAENFASWLTTANKQVVAPVILALFGAELKHRREDLSGRFGCRRNGYQWSYIVEHCLNCIFGFPLWVGNQDWGYCNEDPRRLPEFLSFYMRLPNGPTAEGRGYTTAHILLADLIAHSLNRALEAGSLEQDISILIRQFAASRCWMEVSRTLFSGDHLHSYLEANA